MNISKLLTARDVTTGRPWKRLLELALPLFLGNIAQALYNTVDTIIVGKYVGDDALSAVGAAGPLVNFIFIFFIGIATGAGIIASQRFGAKDREGLSLVMGNTLILTIIVSIITTILGLAITLLPIFGGKDLLQIMNTPEGTIYEWCRQYMTVIFCGVTATIFYNMFAGSMRALGDSVSALIFLLISTGINIVLDIYFVARLGLGVFGVALATIIAQAISAIACAVKLFNMKEYFQITRKELKLKGHIIKQILALGIPNGVSQGIFSFSWFLVQSLTNSMGAAVMACNVVVGRVDAFAMLPYLSLGNAMTTYIGQNYGGRKLERIETGSKQGIVMAWITSVTLTLLLFMFGKDIAGWFTETEAIREMAAASLRILSVGYLIMGMNQTLFGFLRGIGSTTTTMVISIITQVVVRVPVAYLLAHLTTSPEYPHGDFRVLHVSLVCAWTMGSVLSLFFYSKKKKMLRANADDTWQLEYTE